jgi:hypothetical protein
MQNRTRDEIGLKTENHDACLSGQSARTEAAASPREQSCCAFALGYHWLLESALEAVQFLQFDGGPIYEGASWHCPRWMKQSPLPHPPALGQREGV